MSVNCIGISLKTMKNFDTFNDIEKYVRRYLSTKWNFVPEIYIEMHLYR